MRIAVIGTGRMGLALGRRLAAAGHDVRMGSRDPVRGREKAAEIGAAAGGGYAWAARGADAVVLAVPWQAAPAALELLGELGGAILVDVTNPFREGSSSEQDVVSGSSGAERIQALAPTARVVKAFNTLYSGVLRSSPLFDGTRPTVFVAGDDCDAKDAVCELVHDVGYEPADAGPLSSARYLEPLAALMTALDRTSRGSEHALKLLVRERPRRRTAEPPPREPAVVDP